MKFATRDISAFLLCAAPISSVPIEASNEQSLTVATLPLEGQQSSWNNNNNAPTVWTGTRCGLIRLSTAGKAAFTASASTLSSVTEDFWKFVFEKAQEASESAGIAVVGQRDNNRPGLKMALKRNVVDNWGRV